MSSDDAFVAPEHKVYFPKVRDFARTEDGDAIVSSLAGRERLDAVKQLAKQRIFAGAEIKVLQERLTWCYLKEGVNHLENCKELAAALHSKVTAHYHGVKGAPGKYVA